MYGMDNMKKIIMIVMMIFTKNISPASILI